MRNVTGAVLGFGAIMFMAAGAWALQAQGATSFNVSFTERVNIVTPPCGWQASRVTPVVLHGDELWLMTQCGDGSVYMSKVEVKTIDHTTNVGGAK